MKEENGYFNVDAFKKWINNHEESENVSMEGTEVQARYGAKKMMRHMSVESGRAGRVIREFMADGGVIKKASGNEYLVEVASGSFTIDKKFVSI